MEPELKEGDKVLVSNIPYVFFKPKEKDIVGFKYLDKIFIKRIKQVKESRYLVEGDNISDSLRIGWIEKKAIIGKVIFKL